MSALPVSFLTWNTARLLALVLNSLTGLLNYYEREYDFLDSDAVFGLRLMQGNLDDVHDALSNSGHSSEIFTYLKNLSRNASQTAYRALNTQNQRHPDALINLNSLLNHSLFVGRFSHQKIDEHLRWTNKNLVYRDSDHESKSWFIKDKSQQFTSCVNQLISDNCTSNCYESILKAKGTIGFEISRQVLFISLMRMANCSNIDTLGDSYRFSLQPYVKERCTNIYDELVQFRRDTKKLARITSPLLELLMEQTFVCLQFGFVEFANPHLLVAVLAWQHPVLGCYTNKKPESVPNMGLSADFRPPAKAETSNQSNVETACSTHMSALAGAILVLYLRYLLDPGPWPELRFADHIVQIDSIAAEDQFRVFKYIEWVHDSSLPLRDTHHLLPKPPPLTWSPDLIAFVLLFIVLAGILVAYQAVANNSERNGFNGGSLRGKRLYAYSYKKL